MKKSLLLCAFIALAACSKSNDKSYIPSSGSPDVFHIVDENLTDKDASWTPATDCRANIAKVLCEVDDENNGSTLDRKCLGGEEQYLAAVEKIYDAFDPITQGAFCHVRRIFIENKFFATAYASQVFTRDADGKYVQLPGGVIGVRKTLLTKAPAYAPWASWKEQQNFARVGELETPLAFPRYQASDELPLLEYALVHEVGHLLDFANQLNNYHNTLDCDMNDIHSAEEYMEKCKPVFAEGSWGSFDWATPFNVKTEKDYTLRSKLCFYECKEVMNPETDVLPLYTGFSKSTFASTYGSTNPMDDFAEAWAARWILQTKKQNIVIKASTDFGVSTEEIYYSERFKQKREYIERFVQGPILYP
ncbi:hypothetical protein [Bdellovibrio sp. NC01]|uniref:hypothetical protein n=1 Tax=Bdellovibrio sp. NC01 TaxID=2220073 RepID=UPI001158EA38|nr:hypothetical protein [Bdellovibrio sp. NC01]QDK36477.1 hypothetical protein DOE51_02115 [Bdellovibrio sp. NC01]